MILQVIGHKLDCRIYLRLVIGAYLHGPKNRRFYDLHEFRFGNRQRFAQELRDHLRHLFGKQLHGNRFGLGDRPSEKDHVLSVLLLNGG